MSNSHAHSYSRSRGGESQTSKARTTQHRSVNRYSPYTRPSHFSPTHGRQRVSSPPTPPHAHPSTSKPSSYQRYRSIGDGDIANQDTSSAYAKAHKRFDGLVGDHEECPGCPVHPPSTRNNNWLDPTATQHRSRYRGYDGHEEEEPSSPLRLHSPPPRQQSCAKPSIQSLQKRMDHFDQVLTKLVRDVADIKRRGSFEQTTAPEPTRSGNHFTSGPPPPPPTTELDRLDRMMDQLHFLKGRSSSPVRDNYHYSPDRRGGTDSHYGCR